VAAVGSRRRHEAVGAVGAFLSMITSQPRAACAKACPRCSSFSVCNCRRRFICA
jgi:hypothetical protein